jgi:hypothetical protein
MDDRTQSAATCHRPIELQVATEALNANLRQIFSGRWYTRREAKPPAKPPIQPAKQPHSSKHNTHASNTHDQTFDPPILELATVLIELRPSAF